MRKFGVVLLGLAGLFLAPFAAAQSGCERREEDPADKSVAVMVLGTYHFANPGHDEHNVAAESVLTPARQAELAALAARLAAFCPTKVMVEMESSAADLSLPSYTAFDPASLLEAPNEIDQIGFRLARLMGHSAVYGVDVQAGPGEEDYFPIDAVRAAARAQGQEAILERLNAPIADWVRWFNAQQARLSIQALLALVNGRDYPGGQDFYYGMLPIGDVAGQAGARLNARWYERNARIFAKLIHAAQPGDRIVLVYGAGHNYWLRHFVDETPGYRGVDPLPYLREGE